MASVLAKTASLAPPGTESRVPWPLSLEDKESDLPTWGGAVFMKDAGVCLMQLDRNLILYRLCGVFFSSPDLNALFSSRWFCSVACKISSLI